MFGRKSSGFVQMYEYGCRNGIIGGLDVALDQMERRIQLWNKFVEIERGIRERARSLLLDDIEQREINEHWDRVATLRASLFQRQKVDGPNSNDTEDLRSLIFTTRAELKTLKANAKLNRSERFVRSATALKELQEQRAEQAKQARRDSGLYWGNSDDVRQTYEVARVRAMRERTELKEHQWNGSGQVSVRFQSGLPVRTVFTGRGRRLQIDPIPEEAWTSPIRSRRRKLSRTKVRIRVASTPEHRPVWFEIPVVIHRPMPSNGVLRRASLIRERLGLSWRYRLILTVACPDAPVPVSAKRPSVGIDIGWRLTPQGLRVAFWADTEGSHGSLIIPLSDLEEFAKIRGLWSVVEKNLAQVSSAILTWRVGKRIPQILVPHFASLTERLSGAELLRLVDVWDDNRIEGDVEMFEQLHGWRRKHIHLWTWALNLRDQLIRKRLELFRHFAASLVERYGTVFLEQFDLRWFSRIAPPESKRISFGTKYQAIAAPSILRQVIGNACRRTGVRLVRIKARNTTKRCHVCGRLEEWSLAKELVHKCSCGAIWDQDHNAALQVLHRGLAQGHREVGEID